MPSSRVPSVSPATGNPIPPDYLHSSDVFFRDTHGRAVLLRGANFSGSSKAPQGQPSHRLQDFWEGGESGNVSFVGQPLNLQDGSADVHLARLKAVGFNCFRFCFTWEAIEHAGPGKYDVEYMDYVVQILRKIKEYGFRVWMDPHQDLFSRFTGGSGAPYWVMLACGINPRNISATYSAFLHCEYPSAEDPKPETFPPMIWATGYVRLAVATLNNLFFAGKEYAPLCQIDGINIQDWLQNHYIEACRQLALHLAKAGDLFESCVIGWDSMNEPNGGYIGYKTLQKLPESWKMRRGPMPSPIQSFHLGLGHAQKVENYDFGSLGPKKIGSIELDPKGTQLWLSAEEDERLGGNVWGWKRGAKWPLGQCMWAAHGVWDDKTGKILKDDYFKVKEGDFVSTFWLPHWRLYAASLRSAHPEAIMFLQLPVFEPPPKELTEADLKGRSANSAHYYDGLTLITKHWNWFNADALGILRGKYSSIAFAIKVGFNAIRKSLREQMGYLKLDTAENMGKYPTIIGETGVPFDLDHKKAYFGDKRGRGIGDYSEQTSALDASLSACDGKNILGYALWTYCTESTHAWGDGWLGEDLSVWSQDDAQESIDSNPHTTANDRAASSNLELSQTSADSQQTKSGSTPRDVTRLVRGARAVAAFSRPYPQAVVGTPTFVDFDIQSSRLDLKVSLTVEDATEAEKDQVGTVIFLPIVHYAADSILDNPSKKEKILSGDPNVDSFPLYGKGSNKVVDELLDLDVQLSAGRYEVQGQYLTWYLSPEDAQKQEEHSLIIKRGKKPLHVHKHAHIWDYIMRDLAVFFA
jgi:hypothetical protein